MATKVLLTERVQQMVEDMMEAERVAGRPPMSMAAAANWLIGKGYEELARRTTPVAKKVKP